MKAHTGRFAVLVSLSFAVSVPLTLLAQESAKTPPASNTKPQAAAKLKPPRLRLREVTSQGAGEGRVLLVFEVTNPNATPLPYNGYVPESYSPPIPEDKMSPLYQIETQQDGKWKPEQMGWCGTGVGPVSILPKKTKTFEAVVAEKGWERVRVGIIWSLSEQRGEYAVAWSKPLTPKDIEKRGKR